ncbi:MAG: DUF3109 family protein [Saprospiraceae bacterium]|nr:DUF3109 family protein [Saprospiraceae bacterium]
MLLVRNILISDDLFSRKFTCNLSACKGACCWEGDYGAPLEEAEIAVLDEIREKLRPFLTFEGNEHLDRVGTHTLYSKENLVGTPLLGNSACAYLTYDDNGIGQCGIEKAFRSGVTGFQKPISCHLYPVRHSKIEKVQFEALNYEDWSICKAACALGKSLKMPVYRFVREAIIRKFGSDFYAELEAFDEQSH